MNNSDSKPVKLSYVTVNGKKVKYREMASLKKQMQSVYPYLKKVTKLREELEEAETYIAGANAFSQKVCGMDISEAVGCTTKQMVNKNTGKVVNKTVFFVTFANESAEEGLDEGDSCLSVANDANDPAEAE